jgi:hypothetical protein
MDDEIVEVDIKPTFGYIYEIYSPDGDETYIGSTTQYYEHRFNQHYYFKKQHDLGNPMYSFRCSSYDLIDKYGENLGVRLLDESPIDELRTIEQEWIDNTENCVNKRMALQTPEQHREAMRKNAEKKYNTPEGRQYKRDYYAKNKEIIKQKALEKYYDNVEARREYQRNWVKNHTKTEEEKAKQLEKSKQYNKAYKEKHKEKLTEIIVCECGKSVKQISMRQHLTTMKHQLILQKKSSLNSND